MRDNLKTEYEKIEDMQKMGYVSEIDDMDYIKDEVYDMRYHKDKELRKSHRNRKNNHKDYFRKLDNNMKGNTQYLMYDNFHRHSKVEMENSVKGSYNFRYLFGEYDKNKKYKYEVIAKFRNEYGSSLLMGYMDGKVILSLEFVRYNLDENKTSTLYSVNEYNFTKYEYQQANQRLGKVMGNTGYNSFYNALYEPNSRIVKTTFDSIRELNGYLSKVLGVYESITLEDTEMFDEFEELDKNTGEEFLSKDYIISGYMRHWDGKSKIDDKLFDNIVKEYLTKHYFTRGTSLPKIKKSLYDVIKLTKLGKTNGKRRNFNIEYRDDKDMCRSNVKKILGKVKGYSLEDLDEGILDNELVRVKTEERGHFNRY